MSNSTKPSREKAESREMIIPDNVSRPCLEAALEMGYDVTLGVNRNRPEEISCELPVRLYDSHTYRSLLAFADNRIAFRNLGRVIRENQVEVIHCNTPVGGLVGRLCGKRYGVKKVIYTVHGFHFYKGAPLINRTLYKWAEIFMARWTDVILTMNQEDFEAARRLPLRKGGSVYKVHGVGISLSQFADCRVDRRAKRKELGLREEDFLCITTGDLVARKNMETLIRAAARTKMPDLHLLICGKGPELSKLKCLAEKLGIEKQVHLPGFRDDIRELLAVSDLFVFSSLQEGLPRSVMEAMAMGLPVVASRIRGCTDLISDGQGGILCGPKDAGAFAKAIRYLAEKSSLRGKMSKINRRNIREYDISVVKKEIRNIYGKIL